MNLAEQIVDYALSEGSTAGVEREEYEQIMTDLSETVWEEEYFMISDQI
mgnify:CR=1 FL=1